MEKLKALFKIPNFIFPIFDFVYLLQLEEYRTKRYLKLLPRFFWRRNLQRHDKLSMTNHARIIILGVTGLICAGAILKLITFGPLAALVTLVAGFLLTPVLVAFVNGLTNPLYREAKKRTQLAAARKIGEKQKELKIVAVTGSFGKTTTKQFIYDLLRHKYRSQVVPGNVNTAIGISLWVLNMLKPDTELVVVEMGAYIPGEIRESVKVMPPDIAVITALADQHLEQFGTFENLVKAKLEIWADTGKSTVRLISSKYAHLLPDTVHPHQEVDVTAPLKYTTTPSISSEAALEDLRLALRVAEELEVPERFIEDTIGKLVLPERRFQRSRMGEFDMIDDSYNISVTTAKEAVRKAGKIAEQEGKSLCVITAGIPELGEENKNGNKEYGEFLAKTPGISVVFLNTIFQPDLEAGFHKSSENSKVLHASSLAGAFELILTEFSPGKTLILAQPELTDIYY